MSLENFRYLFLIPGGITTDTDTVYLLRKLILALSQLTEVIRTRAGYFRLPIKLFVQRNPVPHKRVFRIFLKISIQNFIFHLFT